MPGANALAPRSKADLINRLQAMGPSAERRSRFDGRGLPPDDVGLSRWRSLAEAKQESELARFDQLLLDGVDPPEAALDVARAYMRWTRSTLAPFVSGAGHHGTIQDTERRAWADHVVRMSEHVERDPAQLEAFLHHWLATVHEAVATGFAAMFAW